MENGIRSLMEMGIPQDVAMDAMQRTNGNLENAVNYIFSNELPPDDQSGNTNSNTTSNNNNNNSNNTNPFLNQEPSHVPLNDTNSELKPGDLSNIIEQSNHIENSNNDDMFKADENNTNNGEVIISRSNSTSSSMTSITNDNPPDYTIMKRSLKKDKINDPTIILPLPPNSLMENYLAIVAWCIAQFMPKWFLIPDFHDLNYDSNWYKGQSLNEPTLKISTSGEMVDDDQNINDVQPETLWQLQKMISIMNDPNSQRSYVSANLFPLAFDNQLRSKLQNYDKLNEILPSFIRSLMMDLEICPGIDKASINETFVSKASYKSNATDPERESYLLLLHFPPEEYDTNLYKMFNTLLYPEPEDERYENNDEDGGERDPNLLAENSLKEVAPFFTILFTEMDEMTETDISLPNGVDIPFEFYPQLYTTKLKNQLVKHIISKRKDAQLRLKECLSEIHSLKNFQGKDIMTILNSSIDYIDKDNSNGKDDNLQTTLESLRDKISSKLKTLKEEYKEITNKLQREWNLSHPEYFIIGAAKQLGFLDEPHLLMMITISAYFYLVRNKTDINEWILIQSNTYGTDFQIVHGLDEGRVRDMVKKYTTRPSQTPIMFNYIKQSHIDSNEDIRQWISKNHGCSKFMKSDELWYAGNNNINDNNNFNTEDNDVSLDDEELEVEKLIDTD